MSRFDDDFEGDRRFGLHMGYVTDRNDPEGLGRVQFCIPGLIEPHGPWAWPLGTVGGGSKNRGFFAVPEVGAEIGVFFHQGSIDHPHFLAGHFGRPDGESEVPPEAQKSPPDNRVFATETFRLEFDESKGGRRLRISCVTTGDSIVMDAEEHSITVEATTGITLKALGGIAIEAPFISIGGRVVRPIQDPI